MAVFKIIKFTAIGAGCILGAAVLFCVTFILSCKSLGGSSSKEDRADYAKRAPNFYDGKFHNDIEFGVLEKNVEEDSFTISQNPQRPDFEFPHKVPDFAFAEKSARGAVDEFNVTWFGHSTIFMQMHGKNILFDPVFSEVISPVSFAGSRRYSHSGVTVDDLPEIDLLILSHDHYDHLDYDVIKQIAPKVKKFIVPLGVENHLKRWGVEKSKIQNMAWWEELNVDGLKIACTPSQHFSGRRIVDNQKTLWVSWVLIDEYHKVFESGDTGFNSHFEKIHEKYGDFDFVMIECGQYNKRWPHIHMFPEESALASKQLGAKVTMPIHWGAIVLSKHGWDDPVERILKAGSAEGLNLITPYIGQTVHLDDVELYKEKWWQK